MMKIFINNKVIAKVQNYDYDEIINKIETLTTLEREHFYLECDGKRLTSECDKIINDDCTVRCHLRLYGGKGGFGSMLRAIGAQIEKTTNREACRDLSGRRLRDINEEKRLKAWLEKKEDREREAEERKKKKIQKLLSVPKHEFKDEHYEETRSKLTEKVSDAVEEGFKKEQEKQVSTEKSTTKRKAKDAAMSKTKKKKQTLWIGDDISDTDDDSESTSEDESKISKKAIKANV